MSVIVLGTVPLAILVTLARGGNFLTTLESATPWPDIAIELHFATALTDEAFDVATVWAADIDGTTAVWNVDADQVDAVIGAKQRKVRLHCVDELADVLVWAVGETRVV